MELVKKNRELVEENHGLKDQLRAAQEQQDIASELKPDENAYWRTIDGKRDGPFCMRCWNVDRKLVREPLQILR